MLAFQNPANGYIERIDRPALWTLLFGCIYFAVKGVWTHAIAALVLAVFTLGLSWLVYPFFAKQILRTHFLRRGWHKIEGEEIAVPDRAQPLIRADDPPRRALKRKLLEASLVVVGAAAVFYVTSLTPEQRKAWQEEYAAKAGAGAEKARAEAKRKAAIEKARDDPKAWEVAAGFANGVRLANKDKASFEIEQILTRRDAKNGTISVCMEWSGKNSFGAREGTQIAVAIYDKDGKAKSAVVQGVQSYNGVASLWNRNCVGDGLTDRTSYVNYLLGEIISRENARGGG